MTDKALRKAAAARIAGNAKCLLVELAQRSNDDGVTDIVSYQDLAESIGVGASTVYHALTRLIDLGFVVRVERVAKLGSRYRVVT